MKYYLVLIFMTLTLSVWGTSCSDDAPIPETGQQIPPGSTDDDEPPVNPGNDDDDDDDDDHDHEHCCHHHHDEDEHDHDHHHHHHDGEECDDPHCGCHHHHHHADEVFTSWGTETVKAYSEAELEHILTALDSGEYGAILRAKGIVAAADGGQWLHYDFVPEEHQVRRGPADYTGRICVIGSQLKEDKLSQLFGL